MPELERFRSVRDQISDRIRDDLLSGRIPAESRLSEAKLAKQFGTSRGPIREALAQLTAEGLLIARPNRSVSVAPEAPDAIREFVIPLRRLTETFALRLIFDSLTERDFRVWDAILHHMERACRDRDLEEVVLQDIAFHRALIRRAGQRDLLAIWQAVFVRVGGHFRRELEHYGDLVSTIFAGHRNLIEVFRSGDKQAAIAALEAHIS